VLTGFSALTPEFLPSHDIDQSHMPRKKVVVHVGMHA